MKKPTTQDVEDWCAKNGYYIGEFWFPYKKK